MAGASLPRPNDRRRSRRAAFLCLWLSETAFDFGAALMVFSMGIWVFQQTGSAQQFSLAILSSVVPAFLVAPFAGAFADGHDRRTVVVVCDVVVAALVASLALMVFQGRLGIPHLMGFNTLIAVFGALRNPSLQAIVSAIVPKDRLPRANGLIGFSQGALQAVAPLVAGGLMARGDLEGVMALSVALIASGAVAIVAAVGYLRGDPPQPARPGRVPLFEGARRSVSTTLAYFRGEPLMRRLAVYALGTQALFILVSEMITPLVLSSHSSRVLGQVMTCGAVGGMLGHLLPMAVGMNGRLMKVALLCNLVLAVSVALAGGTRSSGLWCAYAFVCMAASSVSMSCTHSLWMRKLPLDKQGSVFAMVGASHQLLFCVVMLAGAGLGEHVLEPAMAAGGVLAESLGPLIGTGKGRGFALLFVLCGVCCTVFSLLALAHPRLRRLDALVDDAPIKPDS
jgi:diaminobutyrate-2-oxoglutarate transaminase